MNAYGFDDYFKFTDPDPNLRYWASSNIQKMGRTTDDVLAQEMSDCGWIVSKDHEGTWWCLLPIGKYETRMLIAFNRVGGVSSIDTTIIELFETKFRECLPNSAVMRVEQKSEKILAIHITHTSDDSLEWVVCDAWHYTYESLVKMREQAGHSWKTPKWTMPTIIGCERSWQRTGYTIEKKRYPIDVDA